MQKRHHARVHEADLGTWKQRRAGRGGGGGGSRVLLCALAMPGKWDPVGPRSQPGRLDSRRRPAGRPRSLGAIWRARCLVLQAVRPAPAAGHCCPARRPGLLPGHQGVMPYSVPCPTSAPGKILAQRHRAAPWERPGRDQKERCAWRNSQGKTTVGRAQKPRARPRRPPLL